MANMARRMGVTDIPRIGDSTGVLANLCAAVWPVARCGSAGLAAGGPPLSREQRDSSRLLRWLAAGSVGLGAGLSLAGAPRLVVAAGVAPAVIIGAAIASRPGAHRVES